VHSFLKKLEKEGAQFFDNPKTPKNPHNFSPAALGRWGKSVFLKTSFLSDPQKNTFLKILVFVRIF
jgi:hypothetical protein